MNESARLLLAILAGVVIAVLVLGCATTRDRPVAMHWTDACGKDRYARVWFVASPATFVECLGMDPIGCVKCAGPDCSVVMLPGLDPTHELKHITGMSHPPLLPMLEQWECLP